MKISAFLKVISRKFMLLPKRWVLSVTFAMSLLSVLVFLIIFLVTTVKTDLQNENHPSTTPSVQNFKEYVTRIIKDQSSKIQTLFEKIQVNARTMLKKLDTVKQFKKKASSKTEVPQQMEAPDVKASRLQLITPSQEPSKVMQRSYSSYSTGYGAPSGNSNYGASTYHHHSIGFDPINIVISMSLLSFLLQAIQGLLSRARLPTPVEDGRSMDQTENWLMKYENKYPIKPFKVDKYIMKKKHQKLLKNSL